MKAEILLFEVDPVTEKRIVNTVKPMMISVRTVKPEDHDRRLCEICGVPAMSASGHRRKEDPGPVSAPMMLFAAIPDGLLFVILDRLKQNSVSISHKAAVTPTNLDWTPRELFAEIDREISALRQSRKPPKE